MCVHVLKPRGAGILGNEKKSSCITSQKRKRLCRWARRSPASGHLQPMAAPPPSRSSHWVHQQASKAHLLSPSDCWGEVNRGNGEKEACLLAPVIPSTSPTLSLFGRTADRLRTDGLHSRARLSHASTSSSTPRRRLRRHLALPRRHQIPPRRHQAVQAGVPDPGDAACHAAGGRHPGGAGGDLHPPHRNPRGHLDADARRLRHGVRGGRGADGLHRGGVGEGGPRRLCPAARHRPFLVHPVLPGGLPLP
jgi:hypothetical protein